LTTASVKENCNIAKVSYLTCEDVTRYKNNTKQEWISEKPQDETTRQEKIKGRISVSKTRKKKAVLQVEYLNVDKEVKKRV